MHKFIYPAIFFRLAGTFSVAVCFALPTILHAEVSLSTAAKRYVECSRPLLQVGEVIADQGAGGYGIEIHDEPYYFMFKGRQTFSLLSKDGGAVAHVKIDQPPVEEFSEQVQWRERWMEDIAERSGVPLHRQALSGQIMSLTVNKKSLTGKFAGLSVLVDSQRKLFVQWEWDHSSRYAGPKDLAAMQASTWTNLMPCIANR